MRKKRVKKLYINVIVEQTKLQL